MKKNAFVYMLVLLFKTVVLNAQHQNPIYSGISWFDNKGKVISAHGACILKDGAKYYLFGEAHDDSTNVFVGFNCYSSSDLSHWNFERIALQVQQSGALSANHVGERPKVMKCPQTSEYIMYMHADSLGYKNQFVGYATAKTITGPYVFKGPLLFNGKMIKKWDMGTFQDTDGKGYVLLHGADIYKLSDDYKSIIEHTHKATEKGFEAPTILKKDSLYYFIGSDLTGWERNDNYYFTATSLRGPWIKRGLLAPKGTLTWNSQTTYVLPIVGSKQTTFMFMGDRWSYPKQVTAATYVWQPLVVKGYELSLPSFREGWTVNLSTGITDTLNIKGQTFLPLNKSIIYKGTWMKDTLGVYSSKEKEASCSLTIKATQVALYSLVRPDGGYASISIINSKGKEVYHTNMDMYSKYYTSSQLKFLSPVMPKDTYTIKIRVLDEHWYWKEKSGRVSGSLGGIVSIDKIITRDE